MGKICIYFELRRFLSNSGSKPHRSRMGKVVAVKMPARRLSSRRPEAMPTVVGPREQPTSPARARRANMAVPPVRILAEAMLKVPGQRMPTDKPQSPQPMRPRSGEAEREMSR